MVVYVDGPDRLEQYRADGTLSEVTIDDDNDDVIGNDGDDVYIKYLADGRPRIHARDYFIDEDGKRFDEDGDSISDRMVEYSRRVLQRETIDYQGLKRRIANELRTGYINTN
jgi:hypothetical protein